MASFTVSHLKRVSLHSIQTEWHINQDLLISLGAQMSGNQP